MVGRLAANAPLLEQVDGITVDVRPVQRIDRHHRYLRVSFLVNLLAEIVELRRGALIEDVGKVIEVCTRLSADHEDMVVKALSWALRELSKKHPEQARRFVAKHRPVLAARVIREVENKLTTGRKAPKRNEAL